MEFLVFLFVISHLNLVLTDESVAIDTTTTRQTTYKVHPDTEGVTSGDQVAESSQSIEQVYGRGVVSGGQNEVEAESQNHIHLATHGGHQLAQQQIHIPEGLRHGALHNGEVLQSTHAQGYQPQQILLHQYPIRILDAQASPLRQTHENDKTIGYSSFVEHVSQRDEDEINSALKEGSVGDIKRLVPKSGISFKIYKNENNVNTNVEKPEIQSDVVTHVHQQKVPAGYSTLHHKIKTEVPVTPLKIQSPYAQPTLGVEGLQHTYVKTGEQQHEFEDSQNLLQSTGKTADQQSINAQTVYFTQPEVTSPKTFLELNTKASSLIRPHLKLNAGDGSYGKATSTAEFNSVTNKGSKHILPDYGSLQYQKQWSLDSKTEGSQKAVKNLKPLATLQYELDPVAQAERLRGLHYPQTHAVNPGEHLVQGNQQKTYTDKNANYLASSYVTKGSFGGHLVNKGLTEQKILHRVPGLSESVKTGQNHIIGHLGTNAFGGSQIIQGGQQELFATPSYPDSETAKTAHHDLITHVAQTYVETKGSQNNFDHQKALEGSTSFDIKNAIDNTGSLVHQTNYVSPGAEIHGLEELQKQQIAYIFPKIPASTVLIDNGVHESTVVGGHQLKEFAHASPQLSYHTDVSGKLFHRPQTIVWSPDNLKQGHALTANDLHHSLIKVHLPKEEFYQHVKTPNVQHPTSTISHVSYSQQKQPYVFHYDVPVLKYPQEIHFSKTKPHIQAHQTAHIKLVQPTTIDWSLFKSTLPNVHSVVVKPEIAGQIQESGKKIVPILVRKRKNRSNGKQEIGVVYGKVNNNRRPTNPNHRQEKNIRGNLLSEASNNVKQFEAKGDRNNEFSVSASYKVDRSLKTSNSS